MHEGHHGILEDIEKDQGNQNHSHSHSHASSAKHSVLIKIVSGIIVVLAIAGLLIWKTQF
ncbi:hypothetical protein [Desulfosporosinus youngiae]|jgi:flagellar biogenesis protein FliO|uniref:Uncharacterized protein n=1 Tax=Desulfosporosinus youngiae DSM 17734 TaxID=768710 RepID=H5XX61_9FIRM|nr:hypothetical protein [Desulfosporosinus youngiae]EHQ91001.1 hypothetical protein DesyoDRAFT_4031 [Desulfosporosinus youngiae DSM 17734]